MSAFRRDFDETIIYVLFDKRWWVIKKKYSEIWEKVKNNDKKIWQWTYIEWKISKS